MNSTIDKRLSGRASLNLPASYKPVGASESGRTVTGSTVDIGQGGLKLRLSEGGDLATDEPVYVRIDTTRPEGFITVRGKIRWTRPASGPGQKWEVGVQLTGVDLARWVLWLEEMTREEESEGEMGDP